MSNQKKIETHEEFLTRHHDTGLKLSDGFKFDKYQLFKTNINSRSQIIVIRRKTRIQMVSVDGRLGGGYNINVNSKHGSLYLHYKKYDEALDNMHLLMRLIK